MSRHSSRRFAAAFAPFLRVFHSRHYFADTPFFFLDCRRPGFSDCRLLVFRCEADCCHATPFFAAPEPLMFLPRAARPPLPRCRLCISPPPFSAARRPPRLRRQISSLFFGYFSSCRFDEVFERRRFRFSLRRCRQVPGRSLRLLSIRFPIFDAFAISLSPPLCDARLLVFGRLLCPAFSMPMSREPKADDTPFFAPFHFDCLSALCFFACTRFAYDDFSPPPPVSALSAAAASMIASAAARRDAATPRRCFHFAPASSASLPLYSA